MSIYMELRHNRIADVGCVGRLGGMIVKISNLKFEYTARIQS
jgi:hypothetical protein